MSCDFFTIVGADGFIGRNLYTYLQESECDVRRLSRNERFSVSRHLGCVFYCAGVTADFRERPFDTLDAHVCDLANLLRSSSYSRFVYLSSARVYALSSTSQELSTLSVAPYRMEDYYNLTKLMGESICLRIAGIRAKVVRLSNVYGDDFESGNFLSAVLREAISCDEVTFSTTADSEKDYVHIDDVTRLLKKIAEQGQRQIYNIASGQNITNDDIGSMLTSLLKCPVFYSDEAKKKKFPLIDISKIESEFEFSAKFFKDEFPRLIKSYSRNFIAYD